MLYQSTVSFSCMANWFGHGFQEAVVGRQKTAQGHFSIERTWLMASKLADLFSHS